MGVIKNDVSDYINLLVRIAHIICNHPLQREISWKDICYGLAVGTARIFCYAHFVGYLKMLYQLLKLYSDCLHEAETFLRSW